MTRPASTLSSLLLLAVVLAAAGATAADLCAASGPCLIDRDATLADGTELHLEGRPVTVKRGTTIEVGPAATGGKAGTLRLFADSLTLEPGAAILARGVRGTTTIGGTIVVDLSGALRLQAAGNARARLDAAGQDAGGLLDLRSDGDVDVAGVLAAQSTSGGSGGEIDVTAGGRITIAGGAEVRAAGTARGDGGRVVVTGSDVVVGGPIDVSGADGGTIDVSAGGDLSTTAAGTLDASSAAAVGEGGTIGLDADGSVSLGGAVTATAAGNGLDGGISGGAVGIGAGGSITVGGRIDVSGAPPDGNGGDVDMVADLDITQAAPIVARDAAIDAAGGSVSFRAGRRLALGDRIDVSGGGTGGGSVIGLASGSLTVANDVNADAPGDGGSIQLQAPDVLVTGSLHADGIGGDVEIDGQCTLVVAAPGRISTNGTGDGTNVLRSAGHLELQAGTALFAGGSNRLATRTGSPPPVRNGVAVPPASVIVDPSIPACPAPAGCGNGQIDPGEECDDGNARPCDGCSDLCRVEACPNGTVDCGEACDDGNAVDGDGCDHDCTRTACGNHVQTAGEECDDGNQAPCDGCSPACRVERCGNGVVECTEECDAGDANADPASGCDETCHRRPPPGCGDGHVDAGEECDDGNAVACDGCSADCRIESCGNGTPECAEQCDDFNTDPCDGCNPSCRVERCGNGVPDCGEECDDGNQVNGDGCDENCTRTRCGNGIVTPPEQCDDGNLADGDTCDTACRRRVPCDAGTCIPCTTDVDCDSRGRCAGQQCVAGGCTAVTPLTCDDGVAATRDSCVVDAGGGGAHCEHACLQASACDDGDPCNGAETCDRDTCRAGTPPGGLVGARCALDVVDGVLAGPSAAGLAPKLRRTLTALAAGARTHLAAAATAESAGKRKAEIRALRQADKALGRLARQLARGRKKGSIPPALAGDLLPVVGTATDAIGTLRSALAR
jgi:cysteine-rich repeat protein